MKHFLYFILFVLVFPFLCHGQITKKVLFLGNSYTAVNDVPSLVQNMANSTGDVLTFDSNIPGGYRFMNHATDATTLSKINSNTWDYVVLQAQSQEIALSETQKMSEVYPFAETLSNSVRQNNECSQPLFYMTWGRESGDPSLCPFIPWTCTYEGMDDAIQASYLFMAQNNDAEVAPGGAVWRYLRMNNPSLNLYASDASHPSAAGSYAAACTLYTVIYKKDPTLISWNFTLSENDANSIKLAVKNVVFNQLSIWDFTVYPTIPNFTEVNQGGVVSFTNTTAAFESLHWDFGDGNFSTAENPTHSYATPGIYMISLTSSKCGKVDTLTKSVEVTSVLNTNNLALERKLLIFPNPASDYFTVNFNRLIENGIAVIYDNKGTKLVTKELNKCTSFQMNTNDLSSGIYILKISVEEELFFSKIVKL
ncbi:T9SS type A sorting domain-containing protein [Flavobacterium antarcticum]|uniref:T9SS type A sorting domain-containing protein n=1 Tax=Flavobacterium antarcticum TaxID=271155 RepID=UPI0009FFA829|nr:T9SS type A sorting domain-containing protein [Flavobacterium antarcticum]